MQLDESTSRFEVWKDTWVMVKDHPFGIGLANFARVFQEYKMSNIADRQFLYAHNDVLQLLAEGGWPGFLGVAVGVLLFLGRGVGRVSRLHPGTHPLRFFLGAGALSGLVAILFHSFFDFNLQIPANCIYFVVLLSVVSACTNHYLARYR